MSSSGWLIPAWIIGAPLIAIILSSFMFQGSSTMSGSGSTAPRM